MSITAPTIPAPSVPTAVKAASAAESRQADSVQDIAAMSPICRAC